MTFRELIEKGEGNIYLVNKNNPIRVTPVECVAVTKQQARDRRYFWLYYDYNYRQVEPFLICKKSKAKTPNRRAYPNVVYMSNNIPYVGIEGQDLESEKIERRNYLNYIIFLNKEDACDYVINAIKRKKLELNSHIVKANKLKFSITD